MKEGARPRRPTAFRLDDPEVVVAPEPRQADLGMRRPGRRAIVTPEPEPVETLANVPTLVRPRRRWPWAALFWSSLGGLGSLALGLAVTRLVEDLFARAEWLGWFGLALAAAACLALLAIIFRETRGLARLDMVETLRERASAATLADDRAAARALVRDLLAFERSAAGLAEGRHAVARHAKEIIDGADLIRLAERELMGPLDVRARELVAGAAKRVSVVTAISPRAAVDMLFVFYTALRLVRAVAELYGARPGTLGIVRLVRLVLAHLAVTGGMAAGDSLVQQVLGHGVAAKLSARLGEGVLNGLLTARLGLATIEVVRPLPFAVLNAPTLGELAGGLLRRRGEGRADSDALES